MNKVNPITVEVLVKAPIEKVWGYFNGPEHIVGWAFASPDWEAPEAENDLRVGGGFRTRMQARDGSEGFDFEGTYTAVKNHELIEYAMDDGRRVSIRFECSDGNVKITETFDPESENPLDMQRAGWHAILNNFKKYVENK